MVISKPAVLIYADHPDEDLLRELLAGIEEEGVLYQVTDQAGDPDDLAWEAAKASMLGSGIGIRGRQLAMQMAGLPRRKNVFELNDSGFWQCRNLGANSARAVKKMPFKECITSTRFSDAAFGKSDTQDV